MVGQEVRAARPGDHGGLQTLSPWGECQALEAQPKAGQLQRARNQSWQNAFLRNITCNVSPEHTGLAATACKLLLPPVLHFHLIWD